MSEMIVMTRNGRELVYDFIKYMSPDATLIKQVTDLVGCAENNCFGFLTSEPIKLVFALGMYLGENGDDDYYTDLQQRLKIVDISKLADRPQPHNFFLSFTGLSWGNEGPNEYADVMNDNIVSDIMSVYDQGVDTEG